MYISQKLQHPDERRLRLCLQMGVRHLVLDNRGGGGPAAWDGRELAAYRQWIERFGLRLDIYTLDVGTVLRDSMVHPEQARTLRAMLADNIRKAGDAGIGCLAYDLQTAGTVRTAAKPGRGGVCNPAFVLAQHPQADARTARPGRDKAMWDAIEFLVEGLVPAADAAGVRLACQPQDPAHPAGGLDGVEHVAGSVEGMRRLLALSPSRNHGLQFSQSIVAGMFTEPGKAMVPVIEEFASTGRIFLAGFGNIRGGYLDFEEVFPDEGDVDMFQAVKAYQRGGYAGPLCPERLPVSELDEGGERLAAFALGYARGLLQAAGAWSAA